MSEATAKKADAREAFGEDEPRSSISNADPEYVEIGGDDGGEDFEIEVLDDTPEEDQRPARNPKADEDAEKEKDDVTDYSENVQKRINKLRYDFHEERRLREAAQRQSDEAVRYAQKVLADNQRLQSMASTSLMSQIDAEIAAAEKQYRDAYESADTDAVVEAQRKISDLYARKNMASFYAPQQHHQSENGQDHSNQAVSQPQQFQQPQQQPQDPRNIDPKAVAWLRRNPWFGKDREMTSFAFGLHEKLVVEEGVDPRSDDYFKRIDSRLREKFPEQFDDDEHSGAEEGRKTEVKTEVAVTPQRTPAVAPPSRSGKPPRKVQLTATQVALAKRLGLTPEQYARQLVKDQASGE